MKDTIIDYVVIAFAFIVAAATFYMVKEIPVRQFVAQQLERMN